MEIKDLQNKIENEIKKGEFVKATWQSIKTKGTDTYTKVSSGVVRFVKYGNIKGVQVKGKVNPNEQVLIPNILFHNTNTDNYLVQMATTKVKANVKYYLNGVEIDKAQFEQENPPRKPQLDSNGNPIETIVFRVMAQNLLSLGE